MSLTLLFLYFFGLLCYATVDYEWKGSKNPAYNVKK